MKCREKDCSSIKTQKITGGPYGPPVILLPTTLLLLLHYFDVSYIAARVLLSAVMTKLGLWIPKLPSREISML